MNLVAVQYPLIFIVYVPAGDPNVKPVGLSIFVG